MSYEKYKDFRLAPDDNGCWDVLDSTYQQKATYPSKAAAKRAIDEMSTAMPDTSDELDAIVERFRKQCVSKTNTGNGFESTKADLLKWRDKAIRAEMLSMVEKIQVNGKVVEWNGLPLIDGKKLKQQVISRYGAEDGDTNGL